MIDKAIERFVCGNNQYIFTTEELGLIIPKYIWPKGGTKLNLEEARDYLMTERDSQMSQKFRADLKKRLPECRFEREVPLLIDDRILWDSLAREFGLTGKDKGRRYFVLDYFFPDYDLAFEIDGSQYHGHPEYDEARDCYIRGVYGYRVVRFKDYGSATASMIDDQLKASKEITEGMQWKATYHQTQPFILPGYIPALVQVYRRKNAEALDLTERIIKYVGLRTLSTGEIILKTSEIKSFWQGNLGRPFIISTMQVMDELFRVKLTVTAS